MNVFVACPPRTVTGGVELLHQLCHELDQHYGVNAFIWYPFDSTTDIPKVYADDYHNRTGNPQCGDWVIFPEIWAHLANETEEFRSVIYWESVDNAPKGLKFRDNILHLAQSAYAYDYLQNGLNIPQNRRLMLTDYINKKYLEPFEEGDRVRVVLYNPAKGLNFTKKIIAEMPDVPFVPLRNMTTDEMIDNMRHCMVYVDFGNHPGKDRIPREAAMCGCCVITGRNGSANYEKDVDIPEWYKFERSEMQLPMICNKIRDIFDNFDFCQYQFEHYRETIRSEQAWFSSQVRALVRILNT